MTKPKISYILGEVSKLVADLTRNIVRLGTVSKTPCRRRGMKINRRSLGCTVPPSLQVVSKGSHVLPRPSSPLSPTDQRCAQSSYCPLDVQPQARLEACRCCRPRASGL